MKRVLKFYYSLIGPPNSPGLTGLRWPKGDRGEVGNYVPPGQKGNIGIPGFPGSKRNSGSHGIPGQTGTSGERGIRGPEGPPGGIRFQEIQGEKDILGLPGSKGNPGLPNWVINDIRYCILA
uniref:Uncharacterized protein n=1 Tax=Panagrolaimus davidi TaxID=227884 RepID=A0A914PLD3_9BILA